VRAVLRAVLSEARAEGWRPLHPGNRRAGSFVWAEHDDRVHVQLEVDPAGANLVVTQRMWTGQRVTVAACRVGAWQAALDVLSAYGVVGHRHSSGYRRALADARPGRVTGKTQPSDAELLSWVSLIGAPQIDDTDVYARCLVDGCGNGVWYGDGSGQEIPMAVVAAEAVNHLRRSHPQIKEARA
jgi:hypothetical protein